MARKTPLVQSVASQIVELIRKEHIETGEQLVERQLAEQFRISRSPVREALRLLERRGAVTKSARGGFIAAKSGSALPRISGSETVAEKVYGQMVEDRLD